METQQSTTTNREACERFLKGVKRMVAEKEEERKTTAERYKNDPHFQNTIAELRQLNRRKKSTTN
jgi:hypothetical protein